MRVLKLIIILTLVIPFVLKANVLEDYIQTGLEQNLTLQEKHFSLKKRLSAIAEARGMFMPAISIEARYTRADGGRVIDLHIGDLMNPIYEILQSSIRLENESIPFLREEEHETKVRVIQPVFQPKVYFNYKIKQELRDIEVYNKHVFMRQLVNDIQAAYYQYLKSEQLVALLNKTHRLLEENLRVSNSLFKNDKVTRDAVYRAKAELLAIEEQQAEANKISQHQNGIAKSGYLPGIAAVFGYGYQGEKYQFNHQNDYWMASLTASWKFFNGFQDHHKAKQAKLAAREFKMQLASLKMQIQMQVQEAYYNVNVAWKKIRTVREREKAAVKSFEIVDRKYREGIAPQIEYIEARSVMTQSKVNAIVAHYDFFIKKAELEKVTAVYPIPQGKE